MMNKIALSIYIIMLFAAAVNLPAADLEADQIMLADIPFVYGEEAFVERVERRSAGHEPVGLVLSGGSARAFAHIGVLKRMEEIGVVPDFIVTNSMGSIVGLLYAAGFSPDQITAIILSTDIAGLFEVAVPLKGGIIDVSRFTGLLAEYTGSPDLSELPVPIMVLCEDLRTKRQVRIAEGDFLQIMQAAYALPVYFNPVEYGDHLLIDGGISNLVPLDTAYEYTGQVIASTAFYRNPDLNLRNPLTNLNVAMDVGKSRTGVSQIKEFDPLLIRCSVESFSFMEFDSLREIQAAGYRSADGVSAQLEALDGSPVTPQLAALRAERQAAVEEAVRRYRHLESIPVADPALLLTGGIRIFNMPGSLTYYNTDLHLNAGPRLMIGGLTADLTAGAGIDLASIDGIFPVAGAGLNWDITHALRFGLDYCIRFEPETVFEGSDLAARLRFVPLAVDHFSLGFDAASEISFKGLAVPENTISSFRTDFTAESNPGSEINYSGMIETGAEFPGVFFEFDTPSFFADLRFKLPVPGTSGLLRLDGRAFTRLPLAGQAAAYYSRDGMKSRLAAGEYANADFGEAALVFNPYGFHPAVAELFMFKEIELSVFGSAGRFDELVWSSGLGLDFDLSLIGLKPVTISAWAGWDSGSSGFAGGISLIP